MYKSIRCDEDLSAWNRYLNRCISRKCLTLNTIYRLGQFDRRKPSACSSSDVKASAIFETIFRYTCQSCRLAQIYCRNINTIFKRTRLDFTYLCNIRVYRRIYICLTDQTASCGETLFNRQRTIFIFGINNAVVRRVIIIISDSL